MNVFQDLFQSIFIVYAVLFVSIIFVYAFKICLMLAIGFDCRAKGIKRRAMWMVLSLLFPVPVAIIYACVRNNEEKENYKNCLSCGAVLDERVSYCAGCGCGEFAPCEAEKKQKYAKNSITCLIVSIVSYVLSLACILGFYFSAFAMLDDTFDGIINNSVLGGSYNHQIDDYDNTYHYGYDVDDKTVYYDREGNEYTEDLAVVYYDKNNNTYVIDEGEYRFKGSDGKMYYAGYSYVDEDGYFYFDAAGYENDSKSTVFYSSKNDCYIDSNGVLYYDAEEVSWDKDGKLIDSYGEYLPYESE